MSTIIRRFEDLEVWQEAMRLAKEVYQHTKSSKDFGLRNQMQRAAVSVPSNISEGFERQTNKEYIQFLYIAKGSCAEVRTQLYIAKEVNELTQEVTDALVEQAVKVSKMLYRLIQTRKEKF